MALTIQNTHYTRTMLFKKFKKVSKQLYYFGPMYRTFKLLKIFHFSKLVMSYNLEPVMRKPENIVLHIVFLANGTKQISKTVRI